MTRKEVTEERKNGALVEMGTLTEKEQHLKGHDTDWEDVVKMVESMGFCLVPCENFTSEEGKRTAEKSKRDKGATKLEVRG